jgi:hypothetical protein
LCLDLVINMNKTDKFIAKARIIHGETTYNYKDVIYIDAKTPVTIICDKENHGPFEKAPDNHTGVNKQGCPHCATERRAALRTGTTAKFVEKAKEIHGDKYDYSDTVFVKNIQKVIILCVACKKTPFEMTPKKHLEGHNCPTCAAKSRVIARKETLKNKINEEPDSQIEEKLNDNQSVPKTKNQIFIEKAREKHDTKFKYSKVEYVNNYTKIIIECPKHGEFETTPFLHLNTLGCRQCGIETRSSKQLSTTELFIEKAREKHGPKYDYSLVKYKKSSLPVIIICPDHQKFEITAMAHLAGRGCDRCNLCPSCQLWRTKGELCDYCGSVFDSKAYSKTKEYKIVNFLKRELPDNDFIHNKSIGTDCTNKKILPDIRFDCGLYNLIVEIDEFKHRGAKYDCDKQRMYDIITKLGMPCIFIRYNPEKKTSDPYVLLDMIKQYLQLDELDIIKVFDDYGFKVEYLFYD